VTTPAERAETYLRLMAESELRRALAYPRYESSGTPGPSSGVRPAVRLSRPLLAPLLPPVRSAARRSGLLLASPWLTSPWLRSPWLRSLRPTARTAVSAARRTPAGRAVEPVLWRTLRARPAVRPQPPRGRLAEPPAEAAVGRVAQVASALVAAGTISEATARTVLDSLSDALSLRGKLAARRLYQPPGLRWWGPGSPWQPGAPPPPLPAGPVRAVPIGSTLPLGPGGSLGEAGLLALVVAPDRAVLTAAERLPPTGSPPRGAGHGPPPLPFGHLTAVDDQGARYQADHTSRSPYGRWSVAFELAPVPPPGTRWLDITGPAMTDPVRADLTGPGLTGTAYPGTSAARDPAGPDPATTDPAAPDPGAPDPGAPDPVAPDPGVWASLAARVSPADHPLDALAEKVLAEVTHGYDTGAAALAGLAEVVAALQAATGLTGSAALGRLAALADRLGIPFPPALLPLAQPAGLPDAWLSVLEHRGAADGPDRVAAVAAVLPEVDGARFAVAGLDSAADSATLRVLAWGWQPSPLTSLEDRFSWWARDDRGRWHLAGEYGAHFGGGQVDLLVEFGPALHPQARSLDLLVRGPASQAAVTLPLRWLASR
jgi:hypothetical protein